MHCDKSTDLGWLVGCIGLNGPFRQYFSLYQAVFKKEVDGGGGGGGGEREMVDARKNV